MFELYFEFYLLLAQDEITQGPRLTQDLGAVRAA